MFGGHVAFLRECSVYSMQRILNDTRVYIYGFFLLIKHAHAPVRVTPRHCSDAVVRIFEAASVPRLWARTRAMFPENVEAGLPMKSAARFGRG